ncbi:MAG: ribulose-phosphate 3-epimerase [Bacteroidia bacterium]
MRRIAPSLLAADFGYLAAQIQAVEAAGADWLHCDVMDGHFVPNISFGLPVVAAVRRYSRLPLDVHLMITEPERYIEAFAEAGADIITFHWEAAPHADRLVRRIHQLGKRAGIALNPATPVEVLRDILPFIDLVCVMSVNPGFSGQAFLPHIPQKLQRLSALRTELRAQVLIEVDGGVSPQIAPLLQEADVLVAGSSVFQAPDPAHAIALLRQAFPFHTS